MFGSIWWRITVPYTIILLVTTLGLTIFIATTTTNARLEDLSGYLVDEARLMVDDVAPLLTAEGGSQAWAINDRVVGLAELLGQRVTVIAANGVVLGESHANYIEMENHLFRPEIQQALETGTGSSRRFSTTLRTEVMYAAVAIYEGEDVVGFVRVALPIDEIEANVDRLSRAVVLSGGVTALVGIALATYVSYRTINPVRQLTSAVRDLATGDLAGRLLPTTHDEVGQLTNAFNDMADRLQDQMNTLALERGRLSTVLEHMADGVIITDETGTILLANPAAARILRYDQARAVGRRFAQMAYSHQLIDLWNRCAETQEEQSDTVETALYGNFIHAVITPLVASEPPRYLVMLQDLTHIRRLETVRRDFISNISHELRTPLASLGLVVETLRDGAIEDPPAARRFLTYMETELASLTQMVEELLELSRIESGRVPLSVKPTSVRKLVQKPVKRLQPQAERKGVSLDLKVPRDLPPAMADDKRVHQVVTNLVHNAIKFTPAGGAIVVFAKVQSAARSGGDGQGPAPAGSEGEEILIGVTDTGIGIPEEDLSRIFERFYKTDPARSQEGTGLGLAISKHIVQGHGGRIWVESIEGVGSTFYFALPVAEVE